MNLQHEIRAVKEPSCGGLWCISINGWYYRQNNANLTFSTQQEAQNYISDNYTLLAKLFPMVPK